MNMRSIAKKCVIFVHIVRRVSVVKAAWLNMNDMFIEKKDVLLVQFARRPLQPNKFFFSMKTLSIVVSNRSLAHIVINVSVIEAMLSNTSVSFI